MSPRDGAARLRRRHEGPAAARGDRYAAFAVDDDGRAAHAARLPGIELAGGLAEPRTRARRRALREAVGQAPAAGRRGRRRASAQDDRDRRAPRRPTCACSPAGAHGQVAVAWTEYRGHFRYALKLYAHGKTVTVAEARAPYWDDAILDAALAFAPDGSLLVTYSVYREIHAAFVSPAASSAPRSRSPSATRSACSRPSTAAAARSSPGRRSTPARSATTAAASMRSSVAQRAVRPRSSSSTPRST